MIDLSRRTFLGAAAAAGVMAATGAIASADEPVCTYAAIEPKGLDMPWGGPGSVDGSWNGTPEEVSALGASTMPISELNARRKMYVDAQTDYVRSDGEVIPAVYVKVRALINTYGFGIGSDLNDVCFDWVRHEMTEEEAQAFLDMPWGRQFTTLDFSNYSDYTLEQCEEFCHSLFEKGWLVRAINDRGTHYAQIAEVLGMDEYHVPQILRGKSDVMDFVNFETADCIPVAFGLAGHPLGMVTPCCADVVEGEIDPLDDMFELIKSKNKFCVSPCCCRTLGTLGMVELPGYPDGDFNLSDIQSPICGHDIETCLTVGEEAQFWIDHKVGREITMEEALERLQKSVDQGFIIERMLTREAEVICSCHGDCCGILAHWRSLGGAKDVGNARTFQQVSRYNLSVDFEKCIQCGTCAARCPMDCITMTGEGGYPEVNEMCFRCGQCAYVCPVEARKLVHRPEEELVPLFKDLVELNNMMGADRFERGLIW